MQYSRSTYYVFARFGRAPTNVQRLIKLHELFLIVLLKRETRLRSLSKNNAPPLSLYKNIYVARKPLVDRDHFPKYRTICDTIMEGNLENIRFSDKTGESVYSSKELPSVLFKRIGQKNAKQKVLNNIALNACLAKTGVDGLQVLSASTYKDFLIEDKPFGKGALDTLIAYRLNPSLFDRAVKSLCKLFSFYHCPDLFVKSSDLLKDSPHSKLLLGFKENNESLAAESATLQPILYLTGIQCILEEPTPDLEAKLSSLFPYHKTLIQQELSKLRVSKPKVEASKEPTPPSTYDERLKSSPYRNGKFL